jgi:type IV pilus assembly protein PilA
MPKFMMTILLCCALWPGVVSSAMPRRSFRPAQSLPTDQCSFQDQTQNIPDNEAAAMKSLQSIHAAEATFQATAGNGKFGTLKQLFRAGLIDAAIADGCGYGYRFKVRLKKDSPSSFTATAVPIKYERSGLRSFRLDETGLLYERDPKQAKEFKLSSTIREGTGRVDNESSALSILRTIHSAEATFQSTVGNGEFGTLNQLGAAGLIDPVLAGGVKAGYVFHIRVEPASRESSASFEATAIPLKYEQTGKRSFYVNEMGVVLGADKQGGEANLNDPPVGP